MLDNRRNMRVKISYFTNELDPFMPFYGEVVITAKSEKKAMGRFYKLYPDCEICEIEKIGEVKEQCKKNN